MISTTFNFDPIGEKPDFGDVACQPRFISKSHETHDLFWNIAETDNGLRIKCTGNADLFDESTLVDRLQNYATILRSLISGVDEPIRRLNILSQRDEDVLATLAALPLDDLINDVRKTVNSADLVISSPEIRRVLVSVDQTLQSVDNLVKDIDKDAGPLITSLRRTSDAAHDAVVKAQTTLASANEVLDDNSVIRHNLESMLGELTEAAAAIRTDLLGDLSS